jgi:transposase
MVESRGRGTRYPSAERTRLLRIARRRRAQGWSWSRIGDALGLPGETLRWWSQRRAKTGAVPAARGGAMVPVTIVPGPERNEAMPLALITPSGWRIEGLSLAAALELYRRLGC